jgi:Flp pilus assembly protein TadG
MKTIKIRKSFQRPAGLRAARRRLNQRGNTLIEFALCSILLMLITVGVTDFSRLFSVADTAASAAAAGAQYGALSPAHWSDYTGMQNAALNDAGNTAGVTTTASNTCYCSVGGLPTTCPASCGSTAPITYVTVKVTVPYSAYFNYPWMPTLPSITSTNSVRVQ